MAGLSSTGFTTKSQDEIRTEINIAIQSAFGASVDVSDGSVLGQLAGIMSERYAELWELAEALYAATDPDAATGASLESLASLTGTVREAARPSEVVLTLTGTNLTSVAIGSRASVTGTLKEFTTLEAGVLATLTSWAGSTPYVIGDRRTNAGRSYVCITAGTSASSGGPTTTAADITDNSAHWRYMGEGAAAVDVDAESVDDGPIVATSGAIVTIVTPVSGWSSVINLLDADLGADLETDESLRLRREDELAQGGSSPLDAIRAELLDVEDVTAVTVFHNVTDVTDADGVPPHSVEALVQGGLDQDIYDALLAAVAAGIRTHGTTSGTATDDAGNVHTVKFSRPSTLSIYVDVFLTYDAQLFPTGGAAQVKTKIVEFGDAQKTGKDVVASGLSAQAFKVAGVLDVTLVEIGLSPNPTTSTTIVVNTRQLALFDTSRISVTATPGTP